MSMSKSFRQRQVAIFLPVIISGVLTAGVDNFSHASANIVGFSKQPSHDGRREKQGNRCNALRWIVPRIRRISGLPVIRMGSRESRASKQEQNRLPLQSAAVTEWFSVAGSLDPFKLRTGSIPYLKTRPRNQFSCSDPVNSRNFRLRRAIPRVAQDGALPADETIRSSDVGCDARTASIAAFDGAEAATGT